MKHFAPIDDDSKEESHPDKWSEQRSDDREIGKEIENRQEGDCLNGEFD